VSNRFSDSGSMGKVAGSMDAIQPDPLTRLAYALESLSASQLALADAAEKLAGAADAVPRRRLTGAAETSRKAAREAMAAAAKVSAVGQPPVPGS
jgi:hypothetical protein